jgi:hypothetical protein
MRKKRDEIGDGAEGLGPELGRLWASAPVPKAPSWFAARTMARLRQEEDSRKSWFGVPKWVLIGTGLALLALGWFRWESQPTIRDAEVYAALNALVEEDRESRWWAGV